MIWAGAWGPAWEFRDALHFSGWLLITSWYRNAQYTWDDSVIAGTSAILMKLLMRSNSNLAWPLVPERISCHQTPICVLSSFIPAARCKWVN